MKIECFVIEVVYDDFGLRFTGPLLYHASEASARIDLALRKTRRKRVCDVLNPDNDMLEGMCGNGMDGGVWFIRSETIEILDLTKEI